MRRYLLLVATLYPIAYVIDVFRNPRVDPDHRVLWLILVLLAGMLAMPAYWWLHLRPVSSPTR